MQITKPYSGLYLYIFLGNLALNTANITIGIANFGCEESYPGKVRNDCRYIYPMLCRSNVSTNSMEHDQGVGESRMQGEI
jgi:hypothetical protein